MKKKSTYTIVQGTTFKKQVAEDDVAFAFSDGLNKYVLNDVAYEQGVKYIEADSSITSGFVPRTLSISAHFRDRH